MAGSTWDFMALSLNNDMDFKSNKIIIPEHRLAFFVIEKCASTSIKRALRQSFERPNKLWTETRQGLVVTCNMTSIWDWESYLRITVVRNPWERIFSTWKNKIRKDAVLLKELDSQSYFKPGMSFREFVAHVAFRKDKYLDRHLHSQNNRLWENGYFLPTVIVKMESFPEGWRKVQKMVYEHCKVRLVDLDMFNQTKKINRNRYYDDDLIEMVGKRYQLDVEVFNYEP